MPINFHSDENKNAYVLRNADDTWKNQLNEIIDVSGKLVLDIGCGGGIYTRAIAQMGAKKVIGLDFSEHMINAAIENSKDYPTVSFVIGDALATGLQDGQYDIVFERALVHHIHDLQACCHEIYRLLKPGGTCIIQDRTPEDCFLEGSPSHIRGYFFQRFPKLKAIEINRRHESRDLIEALRETGFIRIKELHLWEVRKKYQDIKELEEDLLNRTGRSILYELDNQELKSLADFININLYNRPNQRLIEKDRWTIWVGRKEGNSGGKLVSFYKDNIGVSARDPGPVIK